MVQKIAAVLKELSGPQDPPVQNMADLYEEVAFQTATSKPQYYTNIAQKMYEEKSKVTTKGSNSNNNTNNNNSKDAKDQELAITGAALYKTFVYNKATDTEAIINMKAHVSGNARVGVDLITVLDISGSMQDANKLWLVKQTLFFVIDQLKTGDRLSVTTFNSSVYSALAFTEMTASGKEAAKNVISMLNAGGGTFLYGGLAQSLQVMANRSLEKSSNKNQVASILFLTDGQATDGITDVHQIKSSVLNFVRQIPDVFTINTFGFGADHNANLLRTISEASHGMFYYISRVPDIAESFADCLGGLMNVVAQKITVQIEAASNVEITKLHTSYKVDTMKEAKKFSVTLNDMFAEEEKDIVLSMKLPQIDAPQDDAPLVFVKVIYNNLVTKQPGCVESHIRVNRTATELPNREPNIAVQRQKYRLATATVIQKAAEAGVKNDVKGGEAMLQATIDTITKEAPNDEFSKKLVTELKTAQTAMKTATSHASAGYAQLQYQQVAQCQQRSQMYQTQQQQQLTQHVQQVHVQQQLQQQVQQQILQQQQQIPQQLQQIQHPIQPTPAQAKAHPHLYNPYPKPQQQTQQQQQIQQQMQQQQQIQQQQMQQKITQQQQVLQLDLTMQQQQQQPPPVTLNLAALQQLSPKATS